MIKGIDTQIMVARTTEVARDSAILAKFGDVAQDNKALKAQIDAAREQQQVQKEEETDRLDLRPDEDGHLGAEYEGGGGKSSRENDGNFDEQDALAPGTFVPRSMNMIDITI